MTKAELIQAIQERSSHHYEAGLQKNQIEAVLASLADVTTAALFQHDEVTLPGLGKLSVNDKAAKEGRNPRTGETIQIAAKRVPKFSASKALKDVIAG